MWASKSCCNVALPPGGPKGPSFHSFPCPHCTADTAPQTTGLKSRDVHVLVLVAQRSTCQDLSHRTAPSTSSNAVSLRFESSVCAARQLRDSRESLRAPKSSQSTDMSIYSTNHHIPASLNNIGDMNDGSGTINPADLNSSGASDLACTPLAGLPGVSLPPLISLSHQPLSQCSGLIECV